MLGIFISKLKVRKKRGRETGRERKKERERETENKEHVCPWVNHIDVEMSFRKAVFQLPKRI
jgi:hypothetical protein